MPRRTSTSSTPSRSWTAFREVDPQQGALPGRAALARCLATGGARSRIDDHLGAGRYFVNNRYTVVIVEMAMPAGPAALHLLIMPRDNQPGGAWSDLQRVKNEVVGDDVEMYQVHPPASETVDAEHTYHLWGYQDATWRLPLGLDRPLHLCAHHDFKTAVGDPMRGTMYLPADTERG